MPVRVANDVRETYQRKCSTKSSLRLVVPGPRVEGARPCILLSCLSLLLALIGDGDIRTPADHDPHIEIGLSQIKYMSKPASQIVRAPGHSRTAVEG